MKNAKYFALALLATSFVSCKNSKEFVINGEFENAGNTQKVYLYVADSLGQMIPIDSTVLNEDKQFVLKGKAEQPEFYQVYAGNRSYMLIAENGDDVKLKADLANQSGSYHLEGSDEADKVTAYNKLTADLSAQTGALAEKYSSMITSNPDAKDSIINEFNKQSREIYKPFLKKSYDFIQENKNSLTAFFAANVMYGTDAIAYENELIAYAKEAKDNFPDNKAVQAFASQMEALEKVAIGKTAPEISAMTPEGKNIKLSDFKGKYVLLDFWASWCGPCRQENPNIVKAYQQFKDKNFTVFGFSLDDNQERWVKAIKDDNLTWNHASELKQWDAPTARLYNINAIPASFIIDPSGKIVAKNLRGEELFDFLQKTL